VNAKSAAPFIALQGFYAAEDATRDKAIAFAKKGVERAPQTRSPFSACRRSMAVGQAREVIKLSRRTSADAEDVRLAHNTSRRSPSSRDMGKITALLNKARHVVGARGEAVRDSSAPRAISQMLAQQQQALAATANRSDARGAAWAARVD